MFKMIICQENSLSYRKFGRRRTRGRRTAIVLSGAKERGIDGPSLDRFYFSRLQPISFLFFDPSSSHMAKLVAAYAILDIDVVHARNACQAWEAAEMFRLVEVESFRSQQCR